MGNKNSDQYSNSNNFIDFSIKIEKICYFPGEKINGTIYLRGKSGLLETQLRDPKALFTIYQYQQYDYLIDYRISTVGKENKYVEYFLFNNFLGLIY